ncbi:hypothetical protein ABZ153_39310 [Streptomyces sp. NPDC006290]|jgi:hypothetical protein|uniref:hypothetical protein n=1 Tax=Streptomyces sp. NPDC006290 TaxID=3156745 RepID=UPI0033A05613
MTRTAGCNDVGIDVGIDGDHPSCPAGALDSFLHGLLTFDSLFAAGGPCVTDTSTGVTLLPGCCDGLEDWRDWRRLVNDESVLGFGHDPRRVLDLPPTTRPPEP